MKTARHRLCILTLPLFAGLICAGTSTITIETAKSDLRDNPNIYDIFPGGDCREIMCVIHC